MRCRQQQGEEKATAAIEEQAAAQGEEKGAAAIETQAAAAHGEEMAATTIENQAAAQEKEEATAAIDMQAATTIARYEALTGSIPATHHSSPASSLPHRLTPATD